MDEKWRIGEMAAVQPASVSGASAGVAPVAAPRPAAAAATAISGRFEGPMSAPKAGSEQLELRVDVDARLPNGATMNRVSGDFFAVNHLNLPGSPPRTWKVYRESWLVESPHVTASATLVEIAGTVRFWHGTHPPANIRIRIAISGQAIGPAQVALTLQGGTIWQYTCSRVSDAFRSLELEVDVCESANRPPLLPDYSVSSHANRPADIPARRLTIERAFAEAGVSITIRPDHSVIDDRNPAFASWSDAELHDVMETHFRDAALEWPRWSLWGLLAGQYEDPRVGGVMFD
ncbi:MAG: hypothetical protein LC791_17830, partial [Acidobacteria bacterium]|nr:hypothetical protein [Acidobacteriota bacterium]